MAFSVQSIIFADLLTCVFVHTRIGSDVVNKCPLDQNVHNYLVSQIKALLQEHVHYTIALLDLTAIQCGVQLCIPLSLFLATSLFSSDGSSSVHASQTILPGSLYSFLPSAPTTRSSAYMFFLRPSFKMIQYQDEHEWAK